MTFILSGTVAQLSTQYFALAMPGGCQTETKRLGVTPCVCSSNTACSVSSQCTITGPGLLLPGSYRVCYSRDNVAWVEQTDPNSFLSVTGMVRC